LEAIFGGAKVYGMYKSKESEILIGAKDYNSKPTKLVGQIVGF